MGCYIDRMETTVTTWYNNILEVDLEVGEEGWAWRLGGSGVQCACMMCTGECGRAAFCR